MESNLKNILWKKVDFTSFNSDNKKYVEKHLNVESNNDFYDFSTQNFHFQYLTAFGYDPENNIHDELPDIYIDIFENGPIFTFSQYVEQYEDDSDKNEDESKPKKKSKLKRFRRGSQCKCNSEAKQFREEGKQLFFERKYLEAMDKFNDGLKYAENESEEMGLAFANRASCFYQLNMFEECLVDIELAQNSYYPKDLAHKLEQRRSKCLSLMKMKNTVKYIEPTLDFEEHEQFAGVANCLEIQKNDQYGKHVIATHDLQIGQTILVERPFTNVEITSRRSSCKYCFKVCGNFIVCQKCNNCLACSDCLKSSVHELECHRPVLLPVSKSNELILQILFKMLSAFPDVHFLMHTVDLTVKGEEVKDLTAAQKEFCMLLQLEHNNDKIATSEILSLKAMHQYTARILNHLINCNAFTSKFSTIKGRRFLQHLVFYFIHIVKNSSFKVYEVNINSITDDETVLDIVTEYVSGIDQAYATAMYPFGSYINHSCDPNIVWLFSDNRLICKVIRPIKNGEQVFRSYCLSHEIFNLAILDQLRITKCLVLNTTEAKAQHKSYLESQYNFECKCSFCSNPVVLSINENKIEAFPSATQMKLRVFRKQSRNEIETDISNMIKALNKYQRFHPILFSFFAQGFLILSWNLLASRLAMSID